MKTRIILLFSCILLFTFHNISNLKPQNALLTNISQKDNIEMPKSHLPLDFSLSSNAGNPDRDGDFTLNWTMYEFADNYSVFWYDTNITDINKSLNALANEILELEYSVQGVVNDTTRYFIVVGHNATYNATSNVIKVYVKFGPPSSFLLYSNADDPDDDGTFDLIWEPSDGADNYTVYSSIQYITVINNATVVPRQPGIEDTIYSIFSHPYGVYYFKIKALNEYGDNLSNCIKVNISDPTFNYKDNGGDKKDNDIWIIIPSYNIFIIIGLTFFISIITMKRVKKK